MIRLAHMTGKSEIENKATILMQTVYGTVHAATSAHTQMLTAVDYSTRHLCLQLLPPRLWVLDTKRMLKTIRRGFIPNKVVLFKSIGEECQELESISEFTKNLTSKQVRVTVYVCRDRKCSLPTTDANQMLEQLDPDRLIETQRIFIYAPDKYEITPINCSRYQKATGPGYAMPQEEHNRKRIIPAPIDINDGVYHGGEKVKKT